MPELIVETPEEKSVTKKRKNIPAAEERVGRSKKAVLKVFYGRKNAVPSSKHKRSVLLINPKWRQLTEPYEHLGLGYLAACLRQSGINTIIWDMLLMGSDAGQIAEKVQQEQVGLIGVSITFQQSATEVLAKIRQQNLRKFPWW